MISVDEALALVVAHSCAREIRRAVLDELVGRALAEDVAADADSPPFDKSMMDGFAVRSGDVTAGMPLKVIGEIRAGSTSSIQVGEGECAAIMTGAQMPEGADAVIVVERCKVFEGMMTTELESCQPGLNVLARGFEFKKDQVVLKAGRRLKPMEVGLLASVGQKFAEILPQPRVGILATGDELVGAGGKLGPGQIRDSNTPTLFALLTAAGTEPFSLGIAKDDPQEIERLIREGLKYDILLLTGGVSMGTADFIPQALAMLGVKEVFHKVALKPGMPIWFGKYDFEEPSKLPPDFGRSVTRFEGLVFGLPGNPVSVLACFELFVTTALRAMEGWADPYPRFFNAKLAGDFTYPTKRETYHPAKLTFTDDGPVVSPVPWFGSADVLGASRADALAVLPVGPGNHKTGDRLRVLPLSKPGWIWTCSGVGGAS
jgi:molybdopterin molybdotransferase